MLLTVKTKNELFSKYYKKKLTTLFNTDIKLLFF